MKLPSAVVVLAVALGLAPRPITAEEWPALARYEAMAVPAENPMTAGKVALGRQLFFDRRMSGDGSVSCSSCHRPANGFGEGEARPVAAYGARSDRSCPTLWNVGYLQAFFWEGSATTLESAVSGMWRFNLASGRGGQASTAEVAARLDAVPGYRRQFVSVFGQGPTVDNVPRAVAAFLRTLVAQRSAWVRFQDGRKDALGPEARRGWALFDGKARCTQCHNGLLLTDQQFHNVGIGSKGKTPDPGREVMTKQERDRGAFKTPTLLNVGLTAPYFHDGSVATLEEAVDLMAGGGLANPHKDAFLAPVALTRAERAALVAFLRALRVDFEAGVPELPQ